MDLVLSLPPGSAYRASLDPADAWSDERHQTANIVDALLVINWRLMGCPEQYAPSPVERPGDAERRAQARRKAQGVRRRIEETRWSDA